MSTLLVPDRRSDPGMPEWTCDSCNEITRDGMRTCAHDGCNAGLCEDSVHDCADCEEPFCRKHLVDSVRCRECYEECIGKEASMSSNDIQGRYELLMKLSVDTLTKLLLEQNPFGGYKITLKRKRANVKTLLRYQFGPGEVAEWEKKEGHNA